MPIFSVWRAKTAFCSADTVVACACWLAVRQVRNASVVTMSLSIRPYRKGNRDTSGPAASVVSGKQAQNAGILEHVVTRAETLVREVQFLEAR